MDSEPIVTLAQMFVDDYLTSPEMRAVIIVLLEELQNSALPEASWGLVLKQIGTLMHESPEDL